MNSTRKQLRGV